MQPRFAFALLLSLLASSAVATTPTQDSTLAARNPQLPDLSGLTGGVVPKRDISPTNDIARRENNAHQFNHGASGALLHEEKRQLNGVTKAITSLLSRLRLGGRQLGGGLSGLGGVTGKLSGLSKRQIDKILTTITSTLSRVGRRSLPIPSQLESAPLAGALAGAAGKRRSTVAGVPVIGSTVDSAVGSSLPAKREDTIERRQADLGALANELTAAGTKLPRSFGRPRAMMGSPDSARFAVRTTDTTANTDFPLVGVHADYHKFEGEQRRSALPPLRMPGAPAEAAELLKADSARRASVDEPLPGGRAVGVSTGSS